jgi:hypothetical protein
VGKLHRLDVEVMFPWQRGFMIGVGYFDSLRSTKFWKDGMLAPVDGMANDIPICLRNEVTKVLDETPPTPPKC